MERVEAEGIRVVTLGAWLDLVEARGWADTDVWLTIEGAARAALPSIRRRLCRGEDLADDLVNEALLRAQRVWRRWRRPGLTENQLAPWLWGVMRNLLRERRRRESRTAGDRDRTAVDPGSLRDGDAAEESAARMAELRRLLAERAWALTQRQRQAIDLHLLGLKHAEAAAELGIMRDAYRDRLRRAIKRLQSGQPAPVRHGQGESAALAQAAAAGGDSRGAALLALQGIGRRHKACAEALGTTVEAVRSRIARLWRRLRPDPGAACSDTDLPPRSLSCEGSASPFPAGGPTDGIPRPALARRGTVHPRARGGGRDPP